MVVFIDHGASSGFRFSLYDGMLFHALSFIMEVAAHTRAHLHTFKALGILPNINII